MTDDRRRWSRPPAQQLNPKSFVALGHSLGPLSEDDDSREEDTYARGHAVNTSTAGLQHDVDSPDREHMHAQRSTSDASGGTRVNAQLDRLQENFEKLRSEREHMEAYCLLMQKNVDTKQELTQHLLSQNKMLGRKVATMEDSLRQYRGGGSGSNTRRKVLPKIPFPNSKSLSDTAASMQSTTENHASPRNIADYDDAPRCTGTV